MSGRRRIARTDGRSPSQAATEKRLTPSDIRRRERRKAERSVLTEQGLLLRQQATFRCFVTNDVIRTEDAPRAERREYSLFESPNSQQDLNKVLCCLSIETPVSWTRNRLAFSAGNMEAIAAELVTKGWIKL
jgi:hypothetical protein